MNEMEIDNGKNLIAATTDNPTVMQAFCCKLQHKFPWILTFTCLLHGLNTPICDMVAYPKMKKIITKTTHIMLFFNSSHYCGRQLNNKANKLGTKHRLKQNCESRFHALTLHCTSGIP
ncbi:hypothetical protein PAXRUDRAFT_768869 [Paxillus rubicundulus Ve08.2h10]|uniref:DUF659 domain-containing protein n=1 Tax=Paxillus rubicundulus Ve08.2h10 TaxID=930991 RepID=A0A0D0CVX2_9AGAM|nr:hypothetical protein PAXRUDRAFT_768869 [Paxillus rubicundulus Ve08.2h10]